MKKINIKYSLLTLLKVYMQFWGWVFQVKVKLKPLKDIEKIDKTQWLSLSNDPHFHLKTKPLKKGWYLVNIHSNITEFQTAKLYPYQRKAHINEHNAFILPIKPHKPLVKIIFIKQSKTQLRFDPQETTGEFSIEKFQLIRVPYFYALFKILKRVRRFKQKTQSFSLIKLYRLLQNQAHKKNLPVKKYILETYRKTYHVKQTGLKYQDWLERHEKLKIQRFLKNKRHISTSDVRFSIVLPTYNPNIEHFKSCVHSVLNQTHDNWQLCIADDASTKISHIHFLEELSAKDQRVSFTVRKQNGHISAASNSALALCDAEYTLLLDHDDTLCIFTLEIFAISILDNPKAKFWYADEDKIDESGFRFMPHFKTDWNPDLLFSQNYIGHPAVYQTELLKQVGGFREGYEGSQDHDLLLRYTQQLRAEEIIHLPWILYHWRAIASSTASNTDAKTYTNNSGIKALQNYFTSQNMSVNVKPGKYANTYQCQWPLPKKPPLVSLLMPTRDGYNILKTAVESILDKTTYPNYEILILNNQSTCTKTLEFLKQIEKRHNNIRVLDWNHQFNYSAINNFGAKHAYGEIIGLINNDIEIIGSDWLTEMVSHAIRPDIGCVGAKLYYSNHKIQHAGVILGIGGVAGHAHKFFESDHPGYFSRLHLTQNYSAVTAACLLVKREIFNKVNGLNENELKVAFNDIDFCLKVRKLGYRNLFTPWAELYHHESITRGQEDTPDKIKRFNKEVNFMKSKWSKILSHDPHYNRNLTLEHENFGLR